MKYYRFKTFTTSYYFPQITSDKKYMYGLYSAFGGKISKTYWYLFKKYQFIRALTSVDEKNLPFPYYTIKKCLGENTTLSFNMGSPGVEQKISILGFDNYSNKPFFAKFSQKPEAIKLTNNEINIYNLLKDSGLTPQLLSYKVTNDYVCIKTEFVKGERPKSRDINSDIINLCLKLKDFHINGNSIAKNKLIYCLSHGDFCPWNILVYNGELRLIDWELAKERPLGYDLFTYICQTAILFEPNKKLIDAINSKIVYIKEFYNMCNINDYIPYLKAFAKEKSSYEFNKGNMFMYEKYNQLKNEI